MKNVVGKITLLCENGENGCQTNRTRFLSSSVSFFDRAIAFLALWLTVTTPDVSHTKVTLLYAVPPISFSVLVSVYCFFLVALDAILVLHMLFSYNVEYAGKTI